MKAFLSLNHPHKSPKTLFSSNRCLKPEQSDSGGLHSPSFVERVCLMGAMLPSRTVPVVSASFSVSDPQVPSEVGSYSVPSRLVLSR